MTQASSKFHVTSIQTTTHYSTNPLAPRAKPQILHGMLPSRRLEAMSRALQRTFHPANVHPQHHISAPPSTSTPPNLPLLNSSTIISIVTHSTPSCPLIHSISLSCNNSTCGFPLTCG